MLKRSDAVRTHRRKWAGVSGGITEPTPLAQALKEIREETDLEETQVQLVRQGDPLYVPDSDNNIQWRVYPFLFAVREPSAIRLDWEHTASRWVDPAELGKLEAVPMFEETWEQLWKT